MCSVTEAGGVPGEQTEHVDGRSLGRAMPWSGRGRGRCYGQAVEGRDEEEEGETNVGLWG